MQLLERPNRHRVRPREVGGWGRQGVNMGGGFEVIDKGAQCLQSHKIWWQNGITTQLNPVTMACSNGMQQCKTTLQLGKISGIFLHGRVTLRGFRMPSAQQTPEANHKVLR